VAASAWYVWWLSVLVTSVRLEADFRRLAAAIARPRAENSPNTAEPLPDIAA